MQEALQQVQQQEGTVQLGEFNKSYFSDITNFRQAYEMAQVISQSELVPDTFRGKPHNCLIVLDISKRMGASPFAIFQNIYLVHGKPAWSSQFLISCINGCGKFTPLRYKEVGERGKDTQGVIAWAKDATGEVLESVPVTIEMAKKEGWYGKNGSKWQTMPDLMLRYRAATFFARTYCPELTMGMKTREEELDIVDVTPKPSVGLFKTEPKREVQTVETTAETAEATAKNDEPKGESKPDEKVADELAAIDSELQAKGITDITAADIKATCERTGNKFIASGVVRQLEAFVKWVRDVQAKESADNAEAK